MELRRIDRHALEWHDRFFAHLESVFDIRNFAGWARCGGWGDRYEVFALSEGEDICATIGVTVLDGRSGEGGPVPVRQLGAVATRLQDRRRGLARRLLDHVLAEADREGAPVLLFGNPSVADFYPRFGFRRLIPDRLFLDLPPGGETTNSPGRRLDPERPEDRALLISWCERAGAHGGVLSARPDASILLWHLLNTDVAAHVLPEGRGLAFVDAADEGVMLCDWLSQDGLPDPDLLLSVAAPLGGRIELGFVPREGAMVKRLNRVPWPEAYMFWRGDALPEGILRFPALMMT
ncbi:GNAT family N-acetyltransferase [Rhizobium sp. CSW-27]|uniref:GNAT family N-acetyltransferase n=1 Tax=Rhizobium sp. CSW-27 TaxID=2839985 RepID=UPI001C012263|nr:GNAT family N-acetyltransferase [Rhizobium sp. CSW-27]MBT9372179.1 GNAT family N-acetyltransferase [Rhizobium sp. CSW-27]